MCPGDPETRDATIRESEHLAPFTPLPGPPRVEGMRAVRKGKGKGGGKGRGGGGKGQRKSGTGRQ